MLHVGMCRSQRVTNYWKGDTVTKLWDAVWADMGLHLVTETKLVKGQGVTYHKSRAGSLSWRTCHDKLRVKGVFEELNV
jgi:pyridoxine/pyridoxamine 5'-phosphate oxidase